MSVPSPGKHNNPSEPISRQRKILIGVVIGALVLLIVAVSGALSQFVIFAGVIATGVGAYAATVGSAKFFRVRSRKIGALVLAGGLFAATIGGAANAATVDPNESVAGISEASEKTQTKPRPPRTSTPTPTPVVTQTEIREPVAIPFESTSVNDASIAIGTSVVTTAGANGEKVIISRVTTTDGVETAREVLREETTVQPVTQVTSVGTKQPVVVAPPAPAPPAAGGGCHPSYSGACVPFASDVDCEGGSGNGPEYVRGPLTVVGPDVYDLERDSDGIACDK
ncbi:G5 domain-containing protein [Mycetocola zhadangensis]|uniref:G5 domain-containing protein n=1 Tax=Mycetocola zhadangensis TaxID=1164595 RepID=A0A3L7J419_9MICO|nr:G5 domain-containing protein [Mycetocola zhadangensis]RLQ84191.1 hypothetical protein D9V28_08185 [Mycetocola zhadangensis]GGE95321.1 hypothetical protein GCM10011313_17860 [Mycetocola zhadangensis]